jgi:hypothetical protein
MRQTLQHTWHLWKLRNCGTGSSVPTSFLISVQQGSSCVGFQAAQLVPRDGTCVFGSGSGPDSDVAEDRLPLDEQVRLRHRN